MDPPRRDLSVGILNVVGDKFTFRPEPSLQFQVRRGDAGSFSLRYGYSEASKAKETLDLRFTLELAGQSLGTKSTRIEDSRIVKDEQWGLLKHETNFPAKGTHKGRYIIEATYSKGAWTGKGPVQATPFKQVGEFTVTVR